MKKIIVLFLICAANTAWGWEPVVGSGAPLGAGFDDSSNLRATDMIEFASMMFCGTWHRTLGGELWATSDGITWNPANSPGFGDRFNRGISSLCLFPSHLYAGTQNTNPSDGCQIWRSSDGFGWNLMVGGGFADTTNREISSMAVFNGFLYAGVTVDPIAAGAGARIFRSINGSSWETVVGDGAIMPTGFGDTSNKGIHSLLEFDGMLYAGTYKLSDGAEIWRTSDGINWNAVVGGGATVADGFGDAFNTDISAMIEFMGSIYVGSRNETSGAQIWKSSDGLVWTKANLNGFGRGASIRKAGSFTVTPSVIIAGTSSGDGAVVFFSYLGEPGTWLKSSSPGFANPNNTDVPTLLPFGGYYYAGTTNTIEGCNLWRTNTPEEAFLPLSNWFLILILSSLLSLNLWISVANTFH